MAYEKLKEEAYQNLGGINRRESIYITKETEFLNLRNYTFVRPGAITSRSGTEANYSLPIASYTMCPVNNIEYVKNSGASYQIFDSGETLYLKNPANTVIGSNILDGETVGLPIGYVIQNDFLYMGNGYATRRFNGTFLIYTGTGPELGFDIANHITFSTSLAPVNGVTVVMAPGTYQFFVGGFRDGYSLNTMAFQTKPRTPISSSNVGSVVIGATVVSKGRWLLYGLDYNPEYGYSGGFVNFVPPGASTYDNGDYTQYFSSTAMLLPVTTFAGVTRTFMEFDHYTTSTISYRTQASLDLNSKFLQTYNNMLVIGGNTQSSTNANVNPSTIYVSNIGRPEEVEEENFFEVRSGNGDIVNGMIVYQDSLIIFKENSVHELTGASPETLSLNDVTLEYGCLSSRGMATFENLLWFIDTRGIVEYNGANFTVVSDAIAPYLDLVDKTKITALYVKNDKQVWFAADQKVFVYDHVVKAWTIYDNLRIDNLSGAAIMSYGSTISEVTYWQSGASFHQGIKFGMSLHTDLGVAITLIHQTRFHKRLGDSTQELWRRHYLNANVPGTTQGVTLNFNPDYGTSTFLTRSLYLDHFQERIDFGISAKSLSIEVIIQASQRIQVNGYTVESRYLRSV